MCPKVAAPFRIRHINLVLAGVDVESEGDDPFPEDVHDICGSCKSIAEMLAAEGAASKVGMLELEVHLQESPCGDLRSILHQLRLTPPIELTTLDIRILGGTLTPQLSNEHVQALGFIMCCCPSLRSLWWRGPTIPDLAPVILRLTLLRELRVTRAAEPTPVLSKRKFWTDLVSGLSSLASLRTLWTVWLHPSIIDNLAGLTQLTSLGVEYPANVIISPQISRLSSLQHLEELIWFGRATEVLGNALLQVSSLRLLEIWEARHCFWANLFSNASQLAQLKSLQAVAFKNGFVDAISTLSNLTHLLLKNSEEDRSDVTKLTKISRLSALKCLGLKRWSDLHPLSLKKMLQPMLQLRELLLADCVFDLHGWDSMVTALSSSLTKLIIERKATSKHAVQALFPQQVSPNGFGRLLYFGIFVPRGSYREAADVHQFLSTLKSLQFLAIDCDDSLWDYLELHPLPCEMTRQ
jgi:hypothetical protein